MFKFVNLPRARARASRGLRTTSMVQAGCEKFSRCAAEPKVYGLDRRATGGSKGLFVIFSVNSKYLNMCSSSSYHNLGC